MKILQVIPYFSPTFGGSAMASYQLSRELAKRGHRVTIFTSNSQRPLYQVPGASVRAFGTLMILASFYVTPGMIKESLQQFDVIHLHDHYTFQNIIAFGKAIRDSVPYVLQAHGSLTTYFQKGQLKRIFNRLWGNDILRHASKMIAVTEAEARQYESMYESMNVSRDKIVVVPNGIDLNEFEDLPKRGEFRKRYGIGQNTKVILFVGRIHKIKGLDLLIKAFTGLTKESTTIKLVIVGSDDGYLPTLKQLIKELHIEEQVLLTGPLYKREKLKAYIDADVYVLPSSYEIFGITLLEACACGTPVVVTDCCGIANVIDNQTGLAIPYDKDQLQNALLRMLSDDEMRLKFGKKGKLLVRERFNWENIAEQMESIYRDIL